MPSGQGNAPGKRKRQFWLKIIQPDDPVNRGDHTQPTGMSQESIKLVKEASEENEGGFRMFNAYRVVAEGDLMLLKVVEMDFLYSATVRHVEWDRKVAESNWEHLFYLKDYAPLGTVSFSKYREEISFMRLLSSLKFTFSIGMWRISPEDFVTIRRLARE